MRQRPKKTDRDAPVGASHAMLPGPFRGSCSEAFGEVTEWEGSLLETHTGERAAHIVWIPQDSGRMGLHGRNISLRTWATFPHRGVAPACVGWSPRKRSRREVLLTDSWCQRPLIRPSSVAQRASSPTGGELDGRLDSGVGAGSRRWSRRWEQALGRWEMCIVLGVSDAGWCRGIMCGQFLGTSRTTTQGVDTHEPLPSFLLLSPMRTPQRWPSPRTTPTTTRTSRRTGTASSAPGWGLRSPLRA